MNLQWHNCEVSNLLSKHKREVYLAGGYNVITYKAKSNTKFSNEMVKSVTDPLNKNIKDKETHIKL
jgi:hypothetical protein